MEGVDFPSAGECGTAYQQNHGKGGYADAACGGGTATSDEHDDAQEHFRGIAHLWHPRQVEAGASRHDGRHHGMPQAGFHTVAGEQRLVVPFHDEEPGE